MDWNVATEKNRERLKRILAALVAMAGLSETRTHLMRHVHRAVLRLLVVLGSVGFVLIIVGLVALRVWPTVFGATLVVVAQLWRIDRFGWLYERLTRA